MVGPNAAVVSTVVSHAHLVAAILSCRLGKRTMVQFPDESMGLDVPAGDLEAAVSSGARGAGPLPARVGHPHS